MQKFSSFGQKKKQTKIRHRMVMLEGLQIYIVQIRVLVQSNYRWFNFYFPFIYTHYHTLW